MKSYLIAASLLVAGVAHAETASVAMNAIDASGIGKAIGTLSLSDTKEGLRVEPKLEGLTAGDHGFHVHVNPDCGPGAAADGKPAAGLAAGGHFDPGSTGKHLGPHGAGHKGDLPVLTVGADGKATGAVVAHQAKVADVKGRSFMIHAGGDNFADQPAPLGGGGGRVACGVLK